MAKKVVVKVNELLVKRNMTLTKLSVLTSIELARLSEFSNNKRRRIQIDFIEKIAEELDIEDIREIITIEKEE